MIILTMPPTRYAMPSHTSMAPAGGVDDINDDSEFKRGLVQMSSKPLTSALPPSPDNTPPAMRNFKYGRITIITVRY